MLVKILKQSPIEKEVVKPRVVRFLSGEYRFLSIVPSCWSPLSLYQFSSWLGSNVIFIVARFLRAARAMTFPWHSSISRKRRIESVMWSSVRCVSLVRDLGYSRGTIASLDIVVCSMGPIKFPIGRLTSGRTGSTLDGAIVLSGSRLSSNILFRSSGERWEIVKGPTSGLIVSGISNWPVAISCEETGPTTGSLTSILSLFSLFLSLSLLLVRLPISAASYLLSLPRLHRGSRSFLSPLLVLPTRRTFAFHLLRAGY